MRLDHARTLAAALAILGLAAPARGQAVRAPVEKPATLAPTIDLNSATPEQLEELPGIGAARAGQIVKARPFKAVEDLKAVKGITPAMYDKIAARLRVTSNPVEPKERPKAKAAAPAAAPGEKIDLNTATAAALQELPGIGAARAEQIIKARPFKAVGDLKAIKGITPAIYEKLADRVTATAPAPAPVASAADPAPKPAETPRSASTPKEAAKAKKAALAPGEKVNLNTASFEKLDALPGIGPVRAELIIKARPFESIEDIKKIKGIKDVEFGKIKDMITVK